MLPYSSSPAFPSPAPMRRQNSNQDQLDPGRPTSPPQLSQLAGDSPASPLPSISNLILLSEFIEKDISTNLIQMIPEISFYLEQLCLSHSSICEKTWTILKNLLETVQSSVADIQNVF